MQKAENQHGCIYALTLILIIWVLLCDTIGHLKHFIVVFFFFFFGFPHPQCFPLKAQILSLTISQSVITGLMLLVLSCRYECSSNFIFSLIVRRLLSLTRYVSVSSRGCCLWQDDYLCHGRITEFLWER